MKYKSVVIRGGSVHTEVNTSYLNNLVFSIGDKRYTISESEPDDFNLTIGELKTISKLILNLITKRDGKKTEV